MREILVDANVLVSFLQRISAESCMVLLYQAGAHILSEGMTAALDEDRAATSGRPYRSVL
jgi:hypothetical protein